MVIGQPPTEIEEDALRFNTHEDPEVIEFEKFESIEFSHDDRGIKADVQLASGARSEKSLLLYYQYKNIGGDPAKIFGI